MVDDLAERLRVATERVCELADRHAELARRLSTVFAKEFELAKQMIPLEKDGEFAAVARQLKALEPEMEEANRALDEVMGEL